MMTLEEAIRHCEEKSCGNSECAAEHRQLAEWLTELKQLKASVSEELEEASLRASIIRGQYIPKEYLDEYPYDAYAQSMFKRGAQWQKQQMMKEAVEVPIEEAVPFGSCKWKLCAKLWLDKGVKGNKVKLIIINED